MRSAWADERSRRQGHGSKRRAQAGSCHGVPYRRHGIPDRDHPLHPARARASPLLRRPFPTRLRPLPVSLQGGVRGLYHRIVTRRWPPFQGPRRTMTGHTGSRHRRGGTRQKRVVIAEATLFFPRPGAARGPIPPAWNARLATLPIGGGPPAHKSSPLHCRFVPSVISLPIGQSIDTPPSLRRVAVPICNHDRRGRGLYLCGYRFYF